MDDKKIVFITGAAKGIGAAVVKKFRDSDYTVVATDIRFRDFFFADGVYYYHMDVRNRENVRRVVEQVEGEIGSIDSFAVYSDKICSYEKICKATKKSDG